MMKTDAGTCASLSVSLLTTSFRLSNHFLLYTPIDHRTAPTKEIRHSNWQFGTDVRQVRQHLSTVEKNPEWPYVFTPTFLSRGSILTRDIVTYKLLSGLYDEQVTLQLDMATIGHSGVGTSWKVGRLNSERLPSPLLPSPLLLFPSPFLSCPLPFPLPSPSLPSP